MAPEWWIEAEEACEEIHAGEWESISNASRDEAISDYIFDRGDAQKDIEKEKGV